MVMRVVVFCLLSFEVVWVDGWYVAVSLGLSLWEVMIGDLV